MEKYKTVEEQQKQEEEEKVNLKARFGCYWYSLYILNSVESFFWQPFREAICEKYFKGWFIWKILIDFWKWKNYWALDYQHKHQPHSRSETWQTGIFQRAWGNRQAGENLLWQKHSLLQNIYKSHSFPTRSYLFKYWQFLLFIIDIGDEKSTRGLGVFLFASS